MNHRILPISVFLILLLSSVCTGYHHLRKAQNAIAADLTQALCSTLREKKDLLITPDTIRVYRHLRSTAGGQVLLAISDEKFRRSLKHEELRQEAFISLGSFEPSSEAGKQVSLGTIQGDTLVIQDSRLGEDIVLKGCVAPNWATVLSISDQRLSLTLLAAAFFWCIFSQRWLGRRQGVVVEAETDAFGGMTYLESDNAFYDENCTPIHFTPMQHQLITLLWETPAHTLSKEKICEALWPGKPDASDTLYTLVRRLKPVLESHTRLRIQVDRGKSYSLKIR